MILLTSRRIGLTIVVVFLLTVLWTLARLLGTGRVAVDFAELNPQGSPHVQVDSLSSTSIKREVIGLVFYGRREFVRVLDCYLKRNLRDNGGILDQVIFTVRTEDPDDLAYLDELLASHAKYSKYVPGPGYLRYVGSWEAVKNPEAIYIKIDDDVIFFEDDAIAAVTKRLEEDTRCFAVSANVINNPLLSWVHYGLGVYEPFWPEMSPPGRVRPTIWRTSALPDFDGPPDGPPAFSKNGTTPAPYKGHRWLPPRASSHVDITSTPASTLTYDPFGPGLRNWAAAAQTHSSFLSRLEKNETDLYRFNTWDVAYARLSINFLAIRGRDVMEVFPFPQPDDEAYLTVVRPKEVGRHVVVDGGALAAHFAFRSQRTANEGRALEWTDLLGRYTDYAEEMVCPFPKKENGMIP